MITIIHAGKEINLALSGSESLLSALQKNGIYVNAPCGGRGQCGKCAVQVLAGNIRISEADEKFFSKSELARGMRLACTCFPESDCKIAVPDSDKEENFEILSDFNSGKSDVESDIPVSCGAKEAASDAKASYNIAIDIGTTTIAITLIDEAGNAVRTVTSLNHQRAYGADVISRIKTATEGKLPELSESIRSDLFLGITRLLSESGTGLSKISKIAVAGNTTMGHLLMGFPCDTLGVYPFEPYNINTVETNFSELFKAACDAAGDGNPLPDIPIILLPGITTYVGADISAGMLFCGFDRSDKINVLIDLGTNGEMAIGNKDKILVTSTAAGPAFEGGNISCGIGSIPGAISGVKISGGKAEYTTIGDKPPIGLCGTGVVETTYELMNEELLDETGMLDEDYFDDGFPIANDQGGKEIVFTQKDVREIQLAKSAVRAGLETLLLRYGATHSDIGNLYIAGGFGFRLDLEKAAGIGLLPEELLGCAKAIGNSSLGGAIEYLKDAGNVKRLEKIIDISGEIPLASDKDFNQFYMDYMFFE